MDFQSDPNWSELKEYALQVLAIDDPMPELTKLMQQEPVVRLWHYSATEPNKVWVLFQPLPGSEFSDQALARKIEWDLPKDQSKFTAGIVKEKPTMRLHDSMVANHEIQQLFQKLGEIEFESTDSNYPNPKAEDEYGITGIGRYANNAKVIWHPPAVASLQPIEHWYHQTLQTIELAFSKQDEEETEPM